MIFYTLKGPSYELEIYQDKIRLKKKPWFGLFSKEQQKDFEIKDLSQFQITVPKFLMISGKIEWQTFNGDVAHFRFSTTPAMVKKIETYLQKRVIKNHQMLHQAKVHSISTKPKHKKNKERKETFDQAA